MAVSPSLPAELAPSDVPQTVPTIRPDLAVIADLVAPNSRVLDIGCGDGELLEYLAAARGADARGMEISQVGVNACVRRGLSVIQGDADHDLEAYPAGAFDYVILSQTLQATRQPRRVLESLARIGAHAIVSFPNFGFWRIRLSLAITGRMPRGGLLSFKWYETPNIHLCTVRDFLDLTRDTGLVIERAQMLGGHGQRITFPAESWLANLFAEQAVFLLRRRD